jgi:hypothetical protein
LTRWFIRVAAAILNHVFAFDGTMLSKSSRVAMRRMPLAINKCSQKNWSRWTRRLVYFHSQRSVCRD